MGLLELLSSFPSSTGEKVEMPYCPYCSQVLVRPSESVYDILLIITRICQHMIECKKEKGE